VMLKLVAVVTVVSTRPSFATSCSVADYGAVADNATDNSKAFRKAAAACAGGIMVVPAGVWKTGPFNLSSNTVLQVVGTISGSEDPSVYPAVSQQPLDEAYRAPYMLNRQHQALVSAYSATNITVTGSGIIDGNGWPWWDNVTRQNCSGMHPAAWHPGPSQPACLIQRPKLVEFVDCNDVSLKGSSDDARLTLLNSPFWTFHPTFCNRVRAQYVNFIAPRDHGNTDGVDPDSCNDVHVSDVLIDVGDDAVSVKSGLHWKTKEKVPARNYLFERTTILYRNFAIGSDVSGDVFNITYRDSVIGDDKGSSPWAIKIKTDSQEAGIVDGVYFTNLTIGNITYCGSSRFVFTPPHSPKDHCINTPNHMGAQMIDVGMGYGLPPTNPGRLRNVVFDGLSGIGPTGTMIAAHGLPNKKGSKVEHIVNMTLKNINLQQGNGEWSCVDVDGVVVDNVKPWSAKSTCPGPK